MYNILKKKKKRSLLKDRSGSMSFFVAFIFLAAITLFLFSFAIPMLINMNVEFYAAGEEILDSTSNIIDQISDASVKAQLDAAVQASKDTTTENVDTLTFFYQYGWILIIIIIVMVMFVKARQSVEVDIR